MRLTSILNCLSALTLADALYWKDAGQVPMLECLIRSLVGYLGVFPSVSLAGCLSCFLASLHFSLAFRSWWGLISLLFFFPRRSCSKVTSSYVPIIPL